MLAIGNGSYIFFDTIINCCLCLRYNFKLDGDHTYYADGYLVHNKMACVSWQDPNVAGGCEQDCSFNCPSGYTQTCTGGATLCTDETCSGRSRNLKKD